MNRISRPLVAHAHAQYQFLFKLGGVGCDFRIITQDCKLTSERAICLSSLIEHAKSGNRDMTSLILSLVVEPSSLRARLQLPLSGSSGIFPDTVVAVTPNVRHHVERLVAAISHHLVTHEDGSVPILEDVVSAVGRDFSDPALTMDIVTSARPVDFRIRKALAFIKGSPVRNPTSAEVVAQVGLSRSRFFEHIRRCLEFRRISTSTGYGCRCHSTTGNE